MNWKLVLSLSLPGLAIGLAVVYGLGESSMWAICIWVVLRLISAIWIARTLAQGHFSHGFLIGFLGGAMAVLSGAVLFETYTANHPEFLENAKAMPAAIAPRTLLLLIAPAAGVVHGLAQAVLAMIAARIVAPRIAG